MSVSSLVAKKSLKETIGSQRHGNCYIEPSDFTMQAKSYLSKTPFIWQILKIYAVSRGLSRRTRKMRKKFWYTNLSQPIMIN